MAMVYLSVWVLCVCVGLAVGLVKFLGGSNGMAL